MSHSKSANYFLSDNRVDSPKYEIKKLINGQIDSVLYSPATHRVLVMAGGYLWKIHPDGYVEDTLRGTSRLRESGITLWTDSYHRGEKRFQFGKWNDWIYSGDKSERDLTSLPLNTFEADVDNESPDQMLQRLYTRLNEAELVEFYQTPRDSDDPDYLALIRERGQWTRLDLSQVALEIDPSCSTYSYRAIDIYQRSCLQGFTRNPRDTLLPLTNLLRMHTDLGEESSALRVSRFKRKFYTFEEGFSGWLLGKILGIFLKRLGMPGSLPESYWVGIAELSLDFRQESFSFKGLVTRKDSRFEMDNFFLYSIPSPSDEDAGYIEITFKGAEYNRFDRTEKFVPYHEEDVGFYTIRRRDCLRGGVVGHIGTPSTPSGTSTGSSTDFSWTLEFSGPWRSGKFANYLWGNIAFLDVPHPAHFILDPVFVAQPFHHIPESIEWVWEGHGKEPAYALRQQDQPVLWLNLAATQPHLRLDLDHRELSGAFAQISSRGTTGSTTVMRIHLHSIREAEGRLQLYLVNQDTQIELHRFKLMNLTDLDKVTFFEPDERSRIDSRFNRGKLKILFEDARANPDTFVEYVATAKQILQRNTGKQSFAPLITEHAVKHFLELIENGDKTRAIDVFYGYVRSLLPDIRSQGINDESVIYNITVFASQGLVLSLRNDDKALEKTIFENLVPPDIDLSAQTNPTFLYNLACYFSIRHNKPMLIAATKKALELGKTPEQFRQDSDFQHYRGDSDFERLLNRED